MFKGFRLLRSVNCLNESTGKLVTVINVKTLTAFWTALTSSVPLCVCSDLNNERPISVFVFGAGSQEFWYLFVGIKLYSLQHVTS